MYFRQGLGRYALYIDDGFTDLEGPHIWKGPHVWKLRSVSEISWFLGPRPWHIEIRHRVKKIFTVNLFGFETLKLKVRRLKLWKPTVGFPKLVTASQIWKGRTFPTCCRRLRFALGNAATCRHVLTHFAMFCSWGF